MSMMNDYESFFKNDPWSEITAPSYPEGRQLYLNDDRFWVSKDIEDRIQFFVHERKIVNIKAIENIAGLEISIIKFNNKSSRFVCTLISDEKSIRDKFSIVVKDVSFHCSKYDGDELFQNVQSRINSWANFLKPTRNGLSASEFTGLWGEFYSICHILMKYHSPLDVMRFWIGPEDKKQDVTLNKIALEIKTSFAGDPLTIKISSLDQLDKVTDNLYILRIVANPTTESLGYSLEDFYEFCLSKLTSNLNAETMFLQKVSTMYGRASDSQLKDKYVVNRISLFHVAEDFPLIKRIDVDPGIAKVQYEIFTSSIAKFEITENLESIIKNG